MPKLPHLPKDNGALITLGITAAAALIGSLDRNFPVWAGSKNSAAFSVHKMGKGWGIVHGGDRYSGSVVCSGFKTKKVAEKAAYALQGAQYDYTQGRENEYVTQGRYGYTAIDERDPESSYGSVRRTVIVGLTKKVAKDLAKCLKDANSGYYSGKSGSTSSYYEEEYDHESNELYLWMVNTGSFYKSKTVPALKTLSKAMASGKYDAQWPRVYSALIRKAVMPWSRERRRMGYGSGKTLINERMIAGDLEEHYRSHVEELSAQV